MTTIDPKFMFPRVSPLAGIKPKIAKTVQPEEKPATQREWFEQVFQRKASALPTKSNPLSFEL